jgi:UDP-N-acetylglucosamine--N-acetylmuramyl-(pentapeptide) pyrophosphoryl-undecaprenol N-acetylglucosamine transferase
MALVVVLAGGGTGGHIFPAIALADTIRKHQPDIQVHFIGTHRELEVTHVRAAGYRLESVPSRPVLGLGPLAALGSVFTLLRGVIAASAILRRLGVSLVIGIGGYASVPTVTAAALSRIPTALLEPNARPGRANRLLARFARALFVQFEEAFNYFPRDRTHLFGFPVRPIPQARRPSDGDQLVRLLVLGGSQGAHSINQAVTAMLDQLSEHQGLRVTHQTGSADYQEVQAAYQQSGVRAEIAPFFDDVLERLTQAALVVSRAGASTVAELCVSGTPSILVPYPFAADDHQMANACELERVGASVVIPDAQLGERLASEIRALAQDAGRRRRMADAALKRAMPDAAERIWDMCRSWI